MAAAYAAIVPLLEVPSGILADRWSRTGLLALASGALALSTLVGGLSANVATYVASAMILGVYFALNSGVIDSIVYDAVLEETGSSAAYETWIGRVRMIEAAAFASSALLGGVLADWSSARATYFVTVPFALASIAAFLRFDEPRLHRTDAPLPLSAHVATTLRAMTQIPQVRRVMLLAALTALLSQTVFEFGPLWLLALSAPAAFFGPYWAALGATTGVGGYLTSKLHLERRSSVLLLAIALAATPIPLALSGSVVAVAVAQVAVLLLVAIIGIRAGLLLHDAVPSAIRTGVSSGVGTFSWLLFFPFSLGFGWLAREHGVDRAGWVIVGVVGFLALLFAVSSRAPDRTGDGLKSSDPDVATPNAGTVRALVPAAVACRELVALASDYLDGELPADWRASLDAHLADCDGCRTYLEQIRVTIEALARLDPDAAIPQRTTGSGRT